MCKLPGRGSVLAQGRTLTVGFSHRCCLRGLSLQKSALTLVWINPKNRKSTPKIIT